MLLLWINSIPFFYISSLVFYLPHSPKFCSHLHGLRLKLQCLSWLFHRFCKTFDLFSYFFAGFILRKVFIVNMYDKSGLKSGKVGFRWSYISVVFAALKGLTLVKNLWLINLVTRYPLNFFIILSQTINTVFFNFFPLWSTSFFSPICISENLICNFFF